MRAYALALLGLFGTERTVNGSVTTSPEQGGPIEPGPVEPSGSKKQQPPGKKPATPAGPKPKPPRPSQTRPFPNPTNPRPTRPPRGPATKGAGRAYNALAPACLFLDCEGDVSDILVCAIDPCSPQRRVAERNQAEKKAEAEKILCELMPTSCKA